MKAVKKIETAAQVVEALLAEFPGRRFEVGFERERKRRRREEIPSRRCHRCAAHGQAG